MKAFVFALVVLVLATGLGITSMAGHAFAQPPKQQVASPQQTAAEQQAASPPQATAEQPASPQPNASSVQQAAAEKLGLPVVITNSMGMKLVLIPAGEFLMGSPESEANPYHQEGPQHRIRITQPFYLGAHEVTQEQYERVMGKNPSKFKGQLLPVDSVSYDDAVSSCQRLSALPSERSAGRTYRLPTEAEWEYACRAGHDHGLHFGNDHRSWVATRGLAERDGKTHPVGEKQPNAWGLYDMHGNVWEWCQDWYGQDYYAKSPPEDPPGPATGSSRVARGGGWGSPASFCRSACRSGGRPGYRVSDLGFRVASVPSGK